MENKVYIVSKLTGDNFFIWRIKMEMVLQKEKLWNIVQEDPPLNANDEWTLKDQSARASIGLALDDKILVTIAGCETAKQTWLKLKKTYEHSNLTSKIHLLKRLYGCKYESYKNMEDYLGGIKEITERLRNIGEVIKDSHLIAVMLCGLPSSYDALITSLESRPESEMDIDFVSSKLRDEATRKENPNNDYQEIAMTSNDKYYNNYRKNKITCHQCGQDGHIRRNCSQLDKIPNVRPESKTNYQNWPNRADLHSGMMTREKEEEDCIDLMEEWALSGAINDDEDNEYVWVLDSGASTHMTPREDSFIETKLLNNPVMVKLANGETVQATRRGNVELKVRDSERNKHTIILNDVLLVPQLKVQLMSVMAMCKNNFIVTFDKNECTISQDNKTLVQGNKNNNVYILQTYNSKKEVANNVCVHVWHKRMGHRCINSIKEMAKHDMVNNLNIAKCNHNDYCEICQLGNMTSRSFKPSTDKATKPFKVMVTDVCGPITPHTYGDNKYILTLTDQHSGYTQIVLMRNKFQTTEEIIKMLKKGHNHFGHFPEVLRTDGGGEFCNRDFDDFLTQNGIVHQISIPHTPQQNGQAERINRSVLSMMRCLIKERGLPIELWGEAAITSAYIHNRFKSAGRSKTPFELWWGKPPQVGHMRTFGSPAYALIPKQLRDGKLGDTSIKGVLVGYGIHRKGYRLWIPGTKRIINATSVSFYEDKYIGETKNVETKNSEIQPGLTHEICIEEEGDNKREKEYDTTIRRSNRTTKGVPAARLSY